MWLHLNDQTAGSPGNLLESVGSLCTIFDWALPQAGWQIEYTGTNKRIYRAASGNRHRLRLDHNAADRPLLRGAENATDVDTLIDPFPTFAQVGAGEDTMLINISQVNWHMFVSETFFYLFVSTTLASEPRATSQNYHGFFFGDVPPSYDQDNNGYNTAIYTRDTTSTSSSTGGFFSDAVSQTLLATNHVYWCRDISGLVKSTHGAIPRIGPTSALPSAGTGWQNRLYSYPALLGCNGSDVSPSINSAITPLWGRGQLPNAFLPLAYAKGDLESEDTFQNLSYNPAANFMVFADAEFNYIYVETTDTWAPVSPIGAL